MLSTPSDSSRSQIYYCKRDSGNCLIPELSFAECHRGKMPGASFVKIMWNCSTYRLLSLNCALNQEVAEQVTWQVLLEIASDLR